MALFEELTTYQSLYDAFLKARKCKRYRPEVLKFSKKLEENLFSLQEELLKGTYHPFPYRQFHIRDPKKRLISAPAFKDRILHHAIVSIIEPACERRFIFDSYACRKDKGTLAAQQRTHHFAKSLKQMYGEFYILKADISKYFYSINLITLKTILAKLFPDEPRLLEILFKIVEFQADVGLVIGAYTSQLFANLYLDRLDHFVKDQLGAKHYIRYMDDFLIFHQDKKYLADVLRKVETFLADQLQLKLNAKTQIFPYQRGIDFCGYRIWPTHILPRKRAIKNIHRKIKSYNKKSPEDRNITKMIRRVNSFQSYTKHCSAYQITNKVIGRIAT